MSRVRGGPAPQIVGTADDDTFTGTADAEISCGLEGDDRIRRGGGDDILHGGHGYHTDRPAGADTIDGGIHNNSCRTDAFDPNHDLRVDALASRVRQMTEPAQNPTQRHIHTTFR